MDWLKIAKTRKRGTKSASGSNGSAGKKISLSARNAERELKREQHDDEQFLKRRFLQSS
jgi:hypothetical protein